MVSGLEFEERWGWWWVRWVMVALHVILAVSSLATLVSLCRMESAMGPYSTHDFGVLIMIVTLATFFGVLGVLTFWLSRYTWGPALAVASVMILAIYYFSVAGLGYRSSLCGIDRLGNETLYLDFNETRIQHCDWQGNSCLLRFPSTVLVQCPALPSFWDHVLALHGGDTMAGSAAVSKLAGWGRFYATFLLIVLFVSLFLAMLLGVPEAVVVRPAAFRAAVPFSSIL